MKHPRQQVFCLHCGKEIQGGAFREFVVNLDNCCGTEVAVVCSEDCWDNHRKSNTEGRG